MYLSSDVPDYSEYLNSGLWCNIQLLARRGIMARQPTDPRSPDDACQQLARSQTVVGGRAQCIATIFGN